MIRKLTLQIITIFIIFCSLEGLELWTSFIHADLLNSLVDLDFHQFGMGALLLVAVYAVFLAVTYMDLRYRSFVKQKIATIWRDEVSEAISNTSYGHFHQKKNHDYIAWFTSDMDQIQEMAVNPSFSLLRGILGIVFSTIGLWSVHWSLVVVVIIEIGILLLLPKVCAKELSKKTVHKTKENERLNQIISDVLLAYDTIFVFQQWKYFKEKIHQASEQLGFTRRNYSKSFAKVAVLGGFGNVLSQISIFLFTGYLVTKGIVTVGAILATTSLAGTIFNAVGNMSQELAMFTSAKPLFEKIHTLTPSARAEENTVETLDNAEVLYNIENLQFAYGDAIVLKPFSKTLFKNHKYVIMGESGTGKSTLLNILGGKIEGYHGNVTLYQKELNTIPYSKLYDSVTYVEQNPHIFQGSIRENIVFQEEISDEKIWNVLDQVLLKSIVEQLPQGLDTMIGDTSSTLSGGQLQRISLARALVRNPQVLLLDEVTANLDVQTGTEIMQSLLQEENLTILWVTHHLPAGLKSLLDEEIIL